MHVPTVKFPASKAISSWKAWLMAWLAGCGLLCSPASAWAGPLLSYELRIAEDEKVVANPNDMMAQMMAAWKTQHELLAARDMPYFQILNTSTEPNALITNFKLSLLNPLNNENFDALSSFVVSPGITYAVVTPADGQGGLRSDMIEINFTGFTPGKFVRFRSDVDCDTGNINMFCDYRTVLTNLSGPYGNSPPGLPPKSQSSVVFSSTVLPFQIPPQPLPDFNAFKPTTTGIGFRSAYSMDSVSPLITGGFIPEPGTWMMLGLLSFAGAFGWGRSRRKMNMK